MRLVWIPLVPPKGVKKAYTEAYINPNFVTQVSPEAEGSNTVIYIASSVDADYLVTDLSVSQVVDLLQG